MDAYCLIGCYREIMRRIAGMDIDLGELMAHLPGRIEFPNFRRPDIAHSPAITLRRYAEVASPRLEVVDEWAAVDRMLDQVSREPFFSFATETISGKNGSQ